MPARTKKPEPEVAGAAWKVLSFRTSVDVRKRAEKVVDAVHRSRGTAKWMLYEWMLEVGLCELERLHKESGVGGVAKACLAHHGAKGGE